MDTNDKTFSDELTHKLNLTVRFTEKEWMTIENTVRKFKFHSKGQAVRYLMFDKNEKKKMNFSDGLLADKIVELDETKSHADRIISAIESKLKNDRYAVRGNIHTYSRLTESLQEISQEISEFIRLFTPPQKKATDEVRLPERKREYQKIEFQGVLINNASSPSGAEGKKVSAFRASVAKTGTQGVERTVYDVFKHSDESDALLIKGCTVQVIGDLDIRRDRIIVVASKVRLIKKS